ELGDTDVIAAATEEVTARSRARRILAISAIALATILLAGAVVLLVATHSWVASGTIAPNVTIAGLDVSGMARQEALGALRTRWVPSLPDAVTLIFPGGQWDARRDELGVELKLQEAVDEAVSVGRGEGMLAALATRLALARDPVQIQVPVEIDEETLEDAVGGLAEIVDRDPVDADIKVIGDEVGAVPGKVGRLLDIDATMRAVSAALADPRAESVQAIVHTQQPAVTAEDLAHIEVVLAAYSTPFNPGRADRTHNLTLAARKLNEVVIRPGEEFSFNRTVGERLVEEGYRQAPIFINGEVQPSTGGGVCQIATTTYNTALLANLDMIERHPHSRPVDYAPTGRDATVYWDQYDLRFRNSLKHPVLILTEVGSSQVTIRMLGARVDDAEVELTREGLTRIPHDTEEVEEPELEAGETEVEQEGRDGWRVTLYRRATRKGQVVRDERLHTDYYRPQKEIIQIGTKAPEKPEGAPEEGAPAERQPDHPPDTPASAEGRPGESTPRSTDDQP
ncbi:MAG: VanW family protein, partial [Armatimonadota bacterium]|nr:VanW family protein [Armatimonadota bacterium]